MFRFLKANDLTLIILVQFTLNSESVEYFASPKKTWE